MTPKMGRPPIDSPRSLQYRLRMTEKDKERLEYCCERMGLTKAEVLREGLSKIYREVKSKEKE